MILIVQVSSIFEELVSVLIVIELPFIINVGLYIECTSIKMGDNNVAPGICRVGGELCINLQVNDDKVGDIQYGYYVIVDVNNGYNDHVDGSIIFILLIGWSLGLVIGYIVMYAVDVNPINVKSVAVAIQFIVFGLNVIAAKF